VSDPPFCPRVFAPDEPAGNSSVAAAMRLLPQKQARDLAPTS